MYDEYYSEPNYDSYYSNHYKNPVLVTYHLYQGGGDSTRAGMDFIGKANTAQDCDYHLSGYDRGHMCNAEDFANSGILEEKTFRYYNVIPQTANLNRGIWRALETKVRKASQKEELFIACGGFFSEKNKRIGKNVYVPDTCYKVVLSIETGKVLYSMIFINKQTGSRVVSYPSDKIEKRVGISFLHE